MPTRHKAYKIRKEFHLVYIKRPRMSVTSMNKEYVSLYYNWYQLAEGSKQEHISLPSALILPVQFQLISHFSEDSCTRLKLVSVHSFSVREIYSARTVCGSSSRYYDSSLNGSSQPNTESVLPCASACGLKLIPLLHSLAGKARSRDQHRIQIDWLQEQFEVGLALRMNNFGTNIIDVSKLIEFHFQNK